MVLIDNDLQCDKERPTCGQCRKACIPCGGYAAHPHFVNLTVTSQGRQEQTHSLPEHTSGGSRQPTPVPERTASPMPPAWETYPDQDELGNECGSGSGSGSEYEREDEQSRTPRTPIQDGHRSPPAPAIITLQHDLIRSSHETQCIDRFWRTYYPDGEAVPEAIGESSLGAWTGGVRILYPSNVVLRKALLAMALTTLGTQDGVPWMKNQGFQLYTAALADASSILRKPSGAGDNDAFLAAIRMFSLYEVRLISLRQWTLFFKCLSTLPS